VLLQLCGSLSWIMVGSLRAQSWRTLTHPCAVAPCGQLWFDSVSSGVRRSSILVDGLVVGSSSCFDASIGGGQWRTDRIVRRSKMVEGQTRTAGMGGNGMGSSFRSGVSSLCFLLAPDSFLPASLPFLLLGPLTRRPFPR